MNDDITTQRLNKAARFNSIESAMKQIEYLKINDVIGIVKVKHKLEIIDV